MASASSVVAPKLATSTSGENLTTVNLLVSLGLIGTGRWLASQPGYRGTGWVLILPG